MPRPELSFYTPGKTWPHNGSYIIVNQAYVQYIPPTNAEVSEASESKLPILFIHGGGLTGTVWEATPDRRPGWAVVASRAPFYRPVYILDTVDSGRSQRCPETLRSDESYDHRTAAEVWERFRIGSLKWFDHGQRVPFVGSQFPVECFDELIRGQSARRRSAEQDEAEIEGVVAAIKEIGRCQIVAHSNGGRITCTALCRSEEAKSLVDRLVLVEPSVTYEQSFDISPVKPLLVWGDYLEDAEYSRMRGLIRKYEEGLPDAECWSLPGRFGITGNTHFPMSDRNSSEIARMIFQWLQ